MIKITDTITLKINESITDILEGKKSLCIICGTNRYRKIYSKNRYRKIYSKIDYEDEDFGIIVIHKKDCGYLKSILEKGIEV